jgi:hypothetical protein
MEIRARFLPSRVYSRWKWTVRGGLLLVPFFSFLAGGLHLYLSPTRYRSTALVEFENSPPAPELAKVMESRANLNHVNEQLDLGNRLNLDQDSVVESLRQMTEVTVIPETRLLEVAVTCQPKDLARDVAAQLVRSLRDYLTGVVTAASKAKADQLGSLLANATDYAEDEATKVANLEKLHGANPAEAAVATAVQRARRAALLADAEVERLRHLRNECLTQPLDTLPRLIVHSDPVISQKPHSPQVGREFSKLIGRSLLLGLLTALLLPYLMELAFPPRTTPLSSQGPAFDSET